MSPLIVNGVVGVGFVLVFQMAIIAAAQAFPVLAPIAAGALGFDPDHVGYFTMIVFVAALLSSNGTAGLLRRWGSIRSAAVTLVLSGLGLAILAVAGSVTGLILGALVMGIAYGPVNPAGSRLLLRVSHGFRRNLVFSIKQTSVAIGGAATGVLLPLAAIAFGWRGAMVALALVCLGVALTALAVRSRLGDDGDPRASIRFEGPIGPARRLLADRSLRSLAIAILAFSSAQFGLMSVYVTFLWSRAGLSPGGAAAMLSLMLGMSVIGRLVWGWLADLGKPIAILAGLAASGGIGFLALLTLGPGQTPLLSATISILLGLGPLSWSGVFLAEIAQEGVSRGGEQVVVTITAGMMVFGYLGGMIGPGCLSLSAVAFGSYGPGIALIGAALALTAILLFRRGQSMSKQPPEGPAA
ncbi:MFS transporter [Oceanibacterium hippocampi]|uniref:Major Facilitator Superfamily protein n=1 Tax=Oceanibacterium hippocampi TaxID=745714 RepID=A0A1Y5SSM9_9PROT|nr:MFS transporter [Oceanibacterium hippocampi]SLN47402.1 Major Facilitator Superfamily protein [Oceanibacterium hippocampi]